MPAPRPNFIKLLLILLLCAVYLPSLFTPGATTNTLLYDKETITTLGTRPFLDTWRFSAIAPTDAPLTSAAPVTATIFWLEYHLWGANPIFYRLVNILLHLASTLLLYQFLRQLKLPPLAAALATLLWALHPINVETVAWIAQQGILLGFLFALLSLRAWLAWCVPQQKPALLDSETSATFCVAALFAAALAIFCDPLFLPLPLMLPLLSWMSYGQLRQREVFAMLPVLAASIICGILLLEEPARPGAFAAPKDALDFLHHLGQSLAFFTAQITFPASSNFLYPIPAFSAILVAFVGLIFVAALIIFFAQRKRLGRAGFAAALCFLLALIPTIGPLNHNPWTPVADHFAYLAAVPLIAGLTAAGLLLLRRRPNIQRPLAIAASLLTVTLAFLSLRRAFAFADAETLYRQTLAENPAAGIISENLATILLERHGPTAQTEALALYQSATDNMPRRTVAALASAHIFVAQNKSREAQDLLAKCIRDNPNDPDANALLADLLVQSIGELAYPVAVKNYEHAFHSAPQNADVALSLAKIYLKQQQLGDARRVLEKTLPFNPRNAQVHLDLANILSLVGVYGEANRQYDIGTALDPKNAEALCNWGIMLIAAGKPADAESSLRRAVALEPLNAKYHMHLGRALRDEIKRLAAFSEFQTAADLDTHYAAPLYEGAQTYLQVNDEGHCEEWLKYALTADPNDLDAIIALSRLWLNAKDPALRNPDSARLLLAKAVSTTKGQDLSILVAYGDALIRAESYEESLDTFDQAIALGQRLNIANAQLELIYMYRTRVLIKMEPPFSLSDSLYSLTGTGLETPMDKPIRPPPERTIRELMTVPIIAATPAREPVDPATLMHFPAEFLPSYNQFTSTTGSAP